MKKNLLYSLAALVLVFISWAAAYFLIGNEYVLPAPWQAISDMGKAFGEKSFYIALGNTLLRTAQAFAISLGFGVILALLAYLFAPIRGLLAPVVSLIRTVPTMSILLILLIWTNPLVAPVVVAVMVLFPVVYAAVLSALDGVGEEYSLLAKSFHVGLPRRVFKMYLPLSAPAVLSQLGSIFSMGLKITVSAEVLAFTAKSLGGMMQESKIYLEMPRLFALTVVVVLLGFAIELLFDVVYRLLITRGRKEQA